MPPLLDFVVPIRVQRVEKIAAPAPTADSAPSHAAGFDAGYEAGRLRAEWEAGRKRDAERARVHGLVTQAGKHPSRIRKAA